MQAPKCRDHQSRDQKALDQRNRLQLSRALTELRQGKRWPSHGEQRVAGQLDWYAQTLEAGRTRTQSWLLHMRQGAALCQRLGLVLHDNLDRRTDDVVEYHILNSTDLLG